MKLLVRNLNRKFTEKDLLELFKPFGKIDAYNLVMDERSGKTKGFGFVEMPVNAEAGAAIDNLNGKIVQGSKIRVKKTNK